jgi:Putative sensor
VSRRARIAAFGSAAGLSVAGVVCGLFGGSLGTALALVLIPLGLVAITSLAFLEVGLSEDRERERERRRAREPQRAARPPGPSPDPRVRRGPLGRMRGQRRKLR